MKKTNQFKSLQILHTAMLAGMVLFSVVSAVVHLQGDSIAPTASLNKTLQVAVLLVAFASVYAGITLFNKRIRAASALSNANEKMAVYRLAAIIKWAMIEVPVLFAVISFMLTRNYAFMALAFALIVLFVLHGPGKIKLMIQLQLTNKEAAELEGTSE